MSRAIKEKGDIEGGQKNSSQNKSRKLEINSIIKLIIILLDVILSGSILIKFFSIENNYNQQYQTLIDDVSHIIQVSQEEINTDIDSIKQTIVSTNVQNITNNNAPIINEEMDERTLLKYADNAFLAEDYESVVQIYSMENLNNNPVACNNMGYMFANGIYFPLNMEMADYYYDKAIELGNIKAYENKLAMHFKYCQDDLIELLQQGYDMGNQRVIEFISSHFEGYTDYTWEDKESIVEQFLTVVSETEQQKLLEQFYVWEKEGYVYLRYLPKDTEVIKYIWVDDIEYFEGTIHIYEKWEKQCVGIEILEAGLEFSD